MVFKRLKSILGIGNLPQKRDKGMVKRESDGGTALRKRNGRDQRLSLRKPDRAQKEAATGKMAFLYKWICGSLLGQAPFGNVKHRYKSLTKYYRVEKRKKKRRSSPSR